MKKKTQNQLTPIELFLFFFKIGWFTFGGGWSIIAQMEEEFIRKRAVITKEELLDMISVGKSLPGIMITNISVIFGYKNCGIPGAIAATLGMITPPIFILTLVTLLYNSIKDNFYVAAALKGIRAAVAPIIFSSVISMWKAGMKDMAGLVFCFGAFVLTAFFDVDNIPVILTGVAIACFLCLFKKGDNQNGAH